MALCPICKRHKTNVMKMYVPSYYITGFGIERLEKTEVCPECGTNLMFLSENCGENVTIDQKNNAVDYFAEVLDNVEDANTKKILIDYINQEPYQDPNPEETQRKREAELKKSKVQSILLSIIVFFGLGALIYYVSGLISSWVLRVGAYTMFVAGAAVLILPFLKKLTK